MPTWYDEAFFLLHYEHTFPHEGFSHPFPGADRDQITALLSRVRPDAVQYPVKGPSGYVAYASRFGNGLPALSYYTEGPDLLTTWREVTRELGIRLILGYSGLIDRQAADTRSDWQRVNDRGVAYPNGALCVNGGYVEELMLPQLDEILDKYEPDGIWVDGDNWTVSPCYCSTCESEYQLMHGRSAPLRPGWDYWDEWLRFHRDSFQRYVGRVARYLHDRNPFLVYATNGGFATHQPEAPPGGPDRLTWDLSPAYSLRQAGLEGRFFDSRGIPFDLITWNRCSARPWPQGKVPALPAYPKTLDHLNQEGSVIFSNGGRWSVWMTVGAEGNLPAKQHETVAEVAEFARARQPYCQESQSIAYVAILHAAATHQKAGNGLYDPGPSLDRVRGAHQAFLELHHPHDIVSEEELIRRLEQYSLVVLPEQIALPLDLDGVLMDWVCHGGRLIASGRVSPRLNEAVPVFAMEDALGVQWTGQKLDEGYVLFRGEALRVAAPFYPVALSGASIMLPLLRADGSAALEESEHPAVTRYTYGQGEVFYIAGDLFTAYQRSQYPGLRALIGEIVEQALPTAPVLTDAPPTVEITLRRQPGRLVVHFANHSPGKSLAQNSAFIEKVPPTEPFSITLALGVEPAAVRLQPGDQELQWSYAEDTLTAFIPSFHLHTMLAIDLSVEAGPETAAEPAAVAEAEATAGEEQDAQDDQD